MNLYLENYVTIFGKYLSLILVVVVVCSIRDHSVGVLVRVVAIGYLCNYYCAHLVVRES